MKMGTAMDALSRTDLEPAAIAKFMTGFSVETTPVTAAKIADFREILRPGTAVYVTFLPGSDYKDSVTAAKRLRAQGFEPIPHFAARSITGAAQFQDYLDRSVSEAGVSRVLAIAGGVDTPLGPYGDSMQLLDSGLFDKYGITSIGVAGHPEGSPDISDEAIRDALKWKNAFAERTDANLYIMTQFCFEAEPILSFAETLRGEGIRLPIHAGLPGVTTLKSLLAYAKACGIGKEELDRVEPTPETQAFLDWRELLMYQRSWLELYACQGFCLEGTASERMARIVTGLTEHYGFKRESEDIRYWTLHMGVDEEHMKVGPLAVERYALTDPQQAQVRASVQKTLDQFWLAFDGIKRAFVDKDPLYAHWRNVK